MKDWRTVILIIITIFIFWFIKFNLKFPNADLDIIGIILTISSILFGFLAGFFISELWTRYTEIRQLQSSRSAYGLNMIKCAENFYNNKKFEKEFKKSIEKCAIVDEIVEWDEGNLELPYYRAIEDSFKNIKVNNMRDNTIFDKILDHYYNLIGATVKLDTLGKERLFRSEWFTIYSLSLIIALSLLFLDVSQIFYKIILLAFPVIIVLALSILYNLDTLLWSKEIISLEPNERLFDAIGVKRFYLKKKKKFISSNIKYYRTEEDLKGDLKQIYLNIIKSRKDV